MIALTQSGVWTRHRPITNSQMVRFRPDKWGSLNLTGKSFYLNVMLTCRWVYGVHICTVWREIRKKAAAKTNCNFVLGQRLSWAITIHIWTCIMWVWVSHVILYIPCVHMSPETTCSMCIFSLLIFTIESRV